MGIYANGEQSRTFHVQHSSTGPVNDDKEETAVRLIQFTLQGYLNGRRKIFPNSAVLMANACRRLHNFDPIKEPSSILDGAPQKYSLGEYASRYWGHHVRSEAIEGLKSLVLQLLAGFDSLIREDSFTSSWCGVHGEGCQGCIEDSRGYTAWHTVYTRVLVDNGYERLGC